MDPQAKKLALRSIQYGLQILTSIDGEELAAAGVNWLSRAAVRAAAHHGRGEERQRQPHDHPAEQHVRDQRPRRGPARRCAKAFFRTTVVEGDTLNGYRYEAAPETGCPLLVDVPYWFEARVTDTIARGDHTVFVAEVVGAGVRDESAVPLSFTTA